MLLYVYFPEGLKPEIIPGLPVRWYGLMYLLAFFVTWLLFQRQIREEGLKVSDDDASSLFFALILGLILGARLFSALIYDTSGIYWRKPWLIFWPFSNGRFTGLQGMSYHGGFIGCCIGGTIWTKKHKQNALAWADTAAAAIPLGYTFGRLGNFLNGELYGRITTSPIGMIFPSVPLYDCFPAHENWVKTFAEQVGITIQEGAQYVNLPRHPSQLYEALFEGVILWIIIWSVRNKKPFNGFLLCLYSIGYGVVRFGIEYFRQPDYELGFRLGSTDTPIYLNQSWTNISTGQILCFIMIAAGLAGIGILSVLNAKTKRKRES